MGFIAGWWTGSTIGAIGPPLWVGVRGDVVRPATLPLIAKNDGAEEEEDDAPEEDDDGAEEEGGGGGEAEASEKPSRYNRAPQAAGGLQFFSPSFFTPYENRR